jgi:surface polysaccharide O-acyltransferase-like enzyme
MIRDNLSSKPAQANFSVDIIRTIAIMMVVLLHSSGFPSNVTTTTISGLQISNWFSSDIFAAVGYLGVPIFIMLSGALLLTPEKADEPPRVFLKKRFNRIGYPFIFWTMIYFAWDFTIGKESFNIYNISRGVLMGSYEHLWFLYLLVGLYAITPILRILVKHLNRNLFLWLLILWFFGTTVTPFLHTFTSFTDFNPIMFVFAGWIGYFLLGIYLVNFKIRRSTANLFLAVGVLGAVLGDWAVTALAGSQDTGFFHNYMSATIILASAGLFFLLLAIPADRLQGHGAIDRGVRWISQNTLPIYLIHMIIIDILAGGVLGSTILFTGNTLIDTPMLMALTFTISCLIIYPLKKIPYLSKLVG